MKGRRLALWALAGVAFGVANYFFLNDWERFINELLGLDRPRATRSYWWDEFRQWVPLSIWAVPAVIVIVSEAWGLQRPIAIAASLVAFLIMANASFYTVYAFESSRQFGLDRLRTDIIPGLVFWSMIALVVGGVTGLVGGKVVTSIIQHGKRRSERLVKSRP